MILLNLDRVYNNLDNILAVFGIFFGIGLILFLMFSGKLSKTGLGSLYISSICIFIFTCFLYLVIKKKSDLDLSFLSQDRTISNSLYLTLNILFVLILTFGIISIYFRTDLYARPFTFFLSIILIYCLLGLEIYLIRLNDKNKIYLILFKMILATICLEISQQLIFPSLLSIDPWWHAWFTQLNINSGHVVEGTVYSKLPVSQVFMGISSIVTNSDYRLTTILVFSPIQVIIFTLATFLLGKYTFNTKVGLLAALILAFADVNIKFGISAIPNSFAAIIMLLVIYLIFRNRSYTSITTNSLVILLLVVIIMSHTVTSTAIAIILLTLWFGLLIYKKINNKEKLIKFTLVTSIFFIVFMFGWWMYASGYVMEQFVSLLQWGFSREYVIGYSLPPDIVLQNRVQIPFTEFFFNYLGLFAYIGLSFIGIFYMLSKKYSNTLRFGLALIALVLIPIGFFGLIVGYSGIEERWWYFTELMGAVPIAISLLLIVGLFKDKWKKFALFSMIFLLSFIMLLNPTANFDNPIFSEHTGVRYALTSSEIQSYNTIQTFKNNRTATDVQFSLLNHYPHDYNSSVKTLSINLQNKSFNKLNNTIIIIRDYIVDNPFEGTINLRYDPRLYLDELHFSQIYDSNTVNAFYKF